MGKQFADIGRIATRGFSRRRIRGGGGYVYVLSNPAMPGLLKIGMTQRTPNHRLKELSGATGVPLPFELVYHARTNDCAAAEQRVHHILRRRRVNPYREFFKVTPDEARKVVRQVASSRIKRGSTRSTGFRSLLPALSGGAVVWGILRLNLVDASKFQEPMFSVMGPALFDWHPEIFAVLVILAIGVLMSSSKGKRRTKRRRRR